jgi:hypothetical protein
MMGGNRLSLEAAPEGRAPRLRRSAKASPDRALHPAKIRQSRIKGGRIKGAGLKGGSPTEGPDGDRSAQLSALKPLNA